MHAADDRDSAPPDDAERPSCVVAIPPPTSPPLCVVCGRRGGRRRRKGACVTCIRKFADCGVTLPEEARPSTPGPRPRDPLLSIVDRMTPAQRTKARLYLGELAAREHPAADAQPEVDPQAPRDPRR